MKLKKAPTIVNRATFTFMYLADTFIKSDLQYKRGTKEVCHSASNKFEIYNVRFIRQLGFKASLLACVCVRMCARVSASALV